MKDLDRLYKESLQNRGSSMPSLDTIMKSVKEFGIPEPHVKNVAQGAWDRMVDDPGRDLHSAIYDASDVYFRS